ncbi:non-homologous end-joining DNA ligase [Gordonia sp. (in: high G+C Gram-positive bacteria)]|uniref:non-homologous end-joining DNA ligase n=1 Tax=Gordonia sp. (in: high G+C Gram-positive bacteria) TaxID=84139 RepID=UPI002638E4DF|nr:non-homologous end-joining DNA ligase [Gordonia sp. (in: high G+C Gram-positive bacteria)]
MAKDDLVVDGHAIALTHLDRVLYPETGTRKYDVITYYLAIAEAILPHLASRPVTRKRWPSGTGSAPFFEKTMPAGAPAWIPRFTIAHATDDKVYPVASNAAVLVWLAQMSALELHVPQWRIDLSTPDARRTDRLVLDLDPGPNVPLTQCAQVALTIRGLLDDAGIPSWPVTSGGKGIHVYGRLPGPVRSDSARAVAKEIAVSLEKTYPDEVTASMNKAARPGRVFLDWSQNSAAKTTLSPYSLRGLEQPWAAAPREWSELADPDLRQLRYSEVLERFSASGDLLAGLDDTPQPLPEGVVDLGVYRRHRRGDDGARLRSADATATSRQADDGEPPRSPGTVVAPRPMLAVDEAIDELPEQEWAFEGKWDGYRILARLTGDGLRLRSRSGVDMTADFPEFGVLRDALAGHTAVLDGEAVAINASGQTDFTLLASRRRRPGEYLLRLYLFDVLEFDGHDLSHLPWEARRAVLDDLAPRFAGTPAIEIPGLLHGPGARAAREARDRGWEGVVAKRRSAPYRPGTRSPDWRKQKNWNDIEVVIGGFRMGREGNERNLGSVLVGLPEATGLRYAGRVGTGWTQSQATDLLAELRELEIRRCPFIGGVDAPVASSAIWVLPKLVADVRFMDWTSTGHLRHPAWRGIRRDKLPGDL